VVQKYVDNGLKRKFVCSLFQGGKRDEGGLYNARQHNMDWSIEHTGLSDSMDLCLPRAAIYEPDQEILCRYETEKPSEFS
jgi:hypothetical protein